MNSIKRHFKSISVLFVFTSLALFSCQKEENILPDQQSTLIFGGLTVEFNSMGSVNGRTETISDWNHVFPKTAELVFTNTDTGKIYILKYNPNDFSNPYSITLPYGPYEFYSIIEGGVFSDFLPFEAKGGGTINSKTFELTLRASTQYGLVTVKDLLVEKASVQSGNNQADLILHQGCGHWYIYIKGGTKTNLKIKESYQGSTIIKEIDVEKKKHYNFILKLQEGSGLIKDLIMEDFELVEEEILVGANAKFFDENGTIRCPEATVGEKGMVNGKNYEAVDRLLLDKRILENSDLSCLCTTLVTDMSFLLFEYQLQSDISSWDVGNVTTMKGMFLNAYYTNPEIGKWNVSKVTDMSQMFQDFTNFNQDIGDWDVSQVTNMEGMFFEAWAFNKPIGNWDVSNVVDMGRMFEKAYSFNQPIGNWNVSKVENMSNMFGDFSSFNQPIENWDVSNVTNMSGMFGESRFFNQPLGKWDVSNVTNMGGMFQDSEAFNQDLTSWCVTNFQSEPLYFALGSPLIQNNKPIWGTCPD